MLLQHLAEMVDAEEVERYPAYVELHQARLGQGPEEVGDALVGCLEPLHREHLYPFI